MIRSGAMKKVLVIGANRISNFLDYTIRDICVLLGDGAGAVILEASDQECGLLAEKLSCDGDALDILAARDSGTVRERFSGVDGFYEVNFDGPKIFKRAVRGMGNAISDELPVSDKTALEMLMPWVGSCRDAVAKKAK
jgi:3-oxoacyl-[acyl-carrier-protein] synthase-3